MTASPAGAARAVRCPEAGPYRRPGGWWARLIGRGLGPLPPGLRRIAYDPAELRAAPGHPVLASLLALAVIATAIGLQLLGPLGGLGTDLVATSLPVLVGDAVSAGTGADAATADLAVTLVVAALVNLLLVRVAMLLVRARRRGIGPFAWLYLAAVEEEQWFRAGSETWSRPRQVAAWLLFGVAHLANVVVSVYTLGALALVGACFALVYRRALRRGDRRAALVAAAKFHAQYNVVAFGLLLAMILLLDLSLVAELVLTLTAG